MSSRHVDAVWSLELDTTTKLLAVYLADCCNRDGELPAQETAVLGDTIHRNNKTTLKALRTLEERGLLARGDTWQLSLESPPRERDIDPTGEVSDALVPPAPYQHSSMAGVPAEEPAPDPDPPAVMSTLDQRLADFCAAWGLTEPSSRLLKAWSDLEAVEAKHNWKEKHKNDKGEHWVVEHESMQEFLPQILAAVATFQWRLENELPVHAQSPVEFIERELWRLPDYQRKPGQEPERSYDEGELDGMVVEMNRQGGPFTTHFRESMKDKDTGETITETLAVYQNRVLGRWNQYQAEVHKFRD